MTLDQEIAYLSIELRGRMSAIERAGKESRLDYLMTLAQLGA